MNAVIDVLTDLGAAYRLTRLVTTDTFPPVKAARDALSPTYEGRRQGQPSAIEELVNCGWCASIWISLSVIAARRIAPKAWSPIARALTFSAVAGMLGTKFDQD